ncbi:hypothetical protein [Chitinophaga pinensis]|uniref:YD repeat-containing protein n=1 Tax=Chitinophaga pinensis (strain ATCC 43595 / DSM 2588 / LMG 13176 / NBRC 15968 / NCIMB 11800 / UQM 2034) TaxID=485918 RepID=A0A979G7A3_CHIPD|nr:hypothetical protein [Chitinophaga pinensis]ACU62081.1 hypothetical protein Cpin_4640 [Chitinophaga pinensis DSM 2588]
MRRQLFGLQCLCFLMCFVFNTSAQSNIGDPQFDYSPKTPAVGAMQQAIDVPVSHFTGSGSFAIPLHTARSKDITVPITIVYQAGGIKVDQDATMVGLGWEFKGGGMISRTVRGNPDEGLITKIWKDTIVTVVGTRRDTTIRYHSKVEEYVDMKGKHGGFYVDNGNSLDIPVLSTVMQQHNDAIKNGQVPSPSDMDWTFYGLNDASPDLFYYDFGNYSGKFFFGNNREPVLVPYNKDIKITPVFSQQNLNGWTNYYFDTWSITTPDGVTYFFGETDNSKSYATFQGGRRPNAWALTKVVNNLTKDSVLFTYDKAISSHTGTFNKEDFVTQQQLDSCNWPSFTKAVEVNGMEECQLATITTRNEQLNFYYSTTDSNYYHEQTVTTRFNRLDSFIVKNVNSAVPYKKIQFTYGSFLSKKLKLMEVLVMNYQRTQIMPYTFNYYDTAFRKVRVNSDSIPFFSYYAQDYWGYYNDARNDLKTTLYINGCNGEGMVSRKAAWPQMQRDALTEILYPTGGKVRLIYEPHSASGGRLMNGLVGDYETFFCDAHHNFSITDTIGGLRIKRIEQIDPVNNDTLIKTFKYNIFGSALSSGFLNSTPSIVTDVSNFQYCGNTISKPKYLVSTQNQQSGAGAGPYISYKNVSVAQERRGVQNGNTQYEYYDDTNTDSSFYFNICTNTNYCFPGSYDVLPNWQVRKPFENLLAGSVKSTRTYNSAGQLLKEEKMTYEAVRYPVMARIIELSSLLNTKICDRPPLPTYDYGNHPGVHYMNRPEDSYTFFRTYAIGKMSVLTRKITTDVYDVNGNKMTDTTTLYYESPYHINPTTSKTIASNGDTLRTETIFSMDLKDVNGTDSLGLQMRNASLNIPVASFTKRNNLVYSGGYILYKRTSPQDTKSILKREEFKLTTSTGVAPLALNLSSTYPKILNFPSTLFQRQAALSYDNDNNPIQLVTKDQEVRGLIWGYNNTLLIADVTNVGIGEIAFTGFEGSDKGNWTIPSATRSNLFFTGSKSYVLAAGNITFNRIPTNKKVVVSYWAMGGTSQVNGISVTGGPMRNGWTYYEHLLPETTTTVTVSGNANIDELRMYPAGSLVTTYNYDPILGLTSGVSPDNQTTYYEYDTLYGLTTTRDAYKNVIKETEYYAVGFNTTAPIWRSTGQSRCKPCPANAAYTTDTLQLLYADYNPKSTTWKSLKWEDAGKSTTCPIVAGWTNTSTPARCQLTTGGQPNGNQEQEQIDANPCSPTYNTKRWVIVGVPNTVCVACIGVDKKVIGGVCQTGNRVNSSSQAVLQPGGGVLYKCTYHFEWSDCSKSADFTENNATPCTINLSCSDW